MTQATATQDTQAPQEGLVFLTTRDVIKKIGLSSTSLQRRRLNDPTFPKPVVLNKGDGTRRNIRWVQSEIESWMRQQLQNRPT